MKWEYLLFNAVVLVGPLGLSFEPRIHYVKRWRYALLPSGITLAIYGFWDILAEGRHWWFHEAYTLPWRLGGLPPGEWLFFFSVPFACLFVWEVLGISYPSRMHRRLRYIRWMLMLLAFPGIGLVVSGKTYTGLVLTALAAAAWTDVGFKTNLLLQHRTYLYLGIVTLLMIVFNGYLTARPIVLYSEQHRLGLNVGTIPMEDFFYGYSLILFNTLLYERFTSSSRLNVRS